MGRVELLLDHGVGLGSLGLNLRCGSDKGRVLSESGTVSMNSTRGG